MICIFFQYAFFTHSGVKAHACNQCEYRCNTPAGLRIHAQKHSAKKRLRCNECDYSCLKAEQLRIHSATHSGESESYAFTTCHYRCSKRSALNVHPRTHAGDKSHKCDRCAYSCGQASGLKTHALTHTGEKPFACTCFKCCRFFLVALLPEYITSLSERYNRSRAKPGPGRLVYIYM